jgi:hypothetical protein
LDSGVCQILLLIGTYDQQVFGRDVHEETTTAEPDIDAFHPLVKHDPIVKSQFVHDYEHRVYFDPKTIFEPVPWVPGTGVAWPILVLVPNALLFV